MVEDRIERGDAVGMAAWLRSIASLVIERHIDESRQGTSSPVAVGAPTKARKLHDRWKMVEPHVESLAPRQQQVVRLRFREGMCYADIAGRLGIPVGTVRSRLARARVAIDEFSGGSTNPVDAHPAGASERGLAEPSNGSCEHSPGL